MSDEQLPPRRRRIAGESARPAAKKTAAKPVARKPVGRSAPAKPDTSKPEKSTLKSSGPKKSTVEESKGAASTRSRSKVADAVARQDKTTSSSVAVEERPKTEKSAAPVSSSGTGSSSTLVAIVAAVSLIAGLGLLAWGVMSRNTESFAESRDSAAGAASTAAETILSYSNDGLSEHHTEAKATMTAKYAETYDTETAPALDEVASQREFAVQAKVRNAGVVPCGSSCSADSAKVLLYVDLDRRIQGNETAEIFGNRLLVDMVRNADGEWKVNDVQGV